MEIQVPVRQTRTTDREESISMEFATTDVDTGLSAHYYVERLDMYHGLYKLFCNFERNRQQSVYYVDSSNALLTYYSRSSACGISENNK